MNCYDLTQSWGEMRRNFEDLRYPAVSQQLVTKKIECQPVEIVSIGDFCPRACTLWWDTVFGLNENATTFPKGKWRLFVNLLSVTSTQIQMVFYYRSDPGYWCQYLRV